jgi:hypothetical protein
MKRGNFLCTFSGGIDIYRLSETDSLAFSVVSRMSRVTWDTKNLFKKNASVVYATGLVNLVSTVLSYLLRIIRLPISQISAKLTKYTTKLPNIIFVLKVTTIPHTSWNIPNTIYTHRKTAYIELVLTKSNQNLITSFISENVHIVQVNMHAKQKSKKSE